MVSYVPPVHMGVPLQNLGHAAPDEQSRFTCLKRAFRRYRVAEIASSTTPTPRGVPDVRPQADRLSVGHGIGEVVATTGLVLLIFALARTGRAVLSAAAVGAYIGSAYWFTSSTSFANPAVTIGRMFSDTFAGIAPASAPVFIAAQLLGGLLGLGLVRYLFPDAAATAAQAVIPHPTTTVTERG